MALEGVPDEGTLARGLSLSRMEALPPGLEKVAHFMVYGMLVYGAHHTRWCIEQALVALGVDLEQLVRQLPTHGCTYRKGIAP